MTARATRLLLAAEGLARSAGRMAVVSLLAVLPVTAAAQPPPAPLTLDRAVARVLERNLAVEAARHRVDIARAAQIAAELRPNPTFALTAENLKLSGPTPAGELYELSATYSQPIELGSKRRQRQAVATLGVSVAEAELAQTLAQWLFEVKRAWYEAVLARHVRAAAVENRDTFERLLALSQARFDEGEIAEGELLKVRLERAKFDTAVAQIELALRQAGIRLLELLGESQFEAPATEGELAAAPRPPDLSSLRAAALGGRPSVLAAERSVVLASERVRLERVRTLPDPAPFVGVRRAGENNTVLFGVSVPLPLFDRNQAAVSRALAEERLARIEAERERLRALAEVESAYRALETARAQVVTFEGGLLAQADESLEIARAGYAEGAIELLNLLEAQRTRTDVRQQYLRSLFDSRVSLAQLELAVGTELPR